MDSSVAIFLVVSLFGVVVGDVCYYYPIYGYYYYCSGYCDGYYYYRYCVYDDGAALTTGAIAGIVIGGIIFLAIVISVIVILCAACNKSRGTTGRVVHPTGNTEVVHSNVVGHGMYYTQPTAPPYPYSTTMYTYPQDSIVPPPPPTYSSPADYDVYNQPRPVRLPPIQHDRTSDNN